MTDPIVLHSIKKFLENNVSPNIRLLKPQDNDVTKFELVHPSVHEVYLPTAGYLPAGTEHNIPCILVGMETGEDNGPDSTLNTKLSFVVFNPGAYNEETGLSPDFSGYTDLLNLITLTKLKLFETIFLDKEGSVKVEKPIRWGMYDEPPYPYWYGYMTFQVPIAPVEYNPDIKIQYE